LTKTKWTAFVLTVFMIVTACASAFANSAEPPCFTVIVSNPPKGLEIYVVESGGEETALSKQDRAWESYYRLFYHLKWDIEDSLHSAKLKISYDEDSFEIPVPDLEGRKYNSLFTLNIEERALEIGQRPHRVPLLVALRVLLTLVIEGIVFFLFGYREKRSLTAFLIINLITQGFLNAMITGPGLGYYFIAFVLLEMLVFLIEMIAFPIAVREKRKGISVLYAFCANAASLIVGGLMISYLPI